MPEIRLNPITRDWVIVATERARRPNQLARAHAPSVPDLLHDPSCPFCPGNEHMTEPETARIPAGSGDWKVRVVPNKYPALSAEGKRTRRNEGYFMSMSGVGFHEVIVENRRHNAMIALLSVDEVAEIIEAYRHRYAALRADDRIEAIVVFKNHGEQAGSSIAHPHSQLSATPVVPPQIRMRLQEAIRFFDETGKCIFCNTLAEELDADERIILSTEHFVAFNPYASLSPFHTWVFPRRHSSSFDEITSEEAKDFALVLQGVLARLYHGLNDPPFNYTIRSVPTSDRETDYYHWYLSIVPRLNKLAGFEIGSGMFINPVVPEEGAAYLRNVPLPAEERHSA